VTFDYVVVGAGAIGGTVGARLAREGRSVLFCDADAEHVAAINERGLTIEGPLEGFTVQAEAVLPDDLPSGLGTVLLAVKHQHTAAAMAQIAPRLAPGGFVVSLQNGMNEPIIAGAIGQERTVGAFVNFGADYLGPGRVHHAGRGAFVIGELDGRPSERVERLVREIGGDARATDNILGFLWSKEAYGAMLFATAVSDLSIADALAEPRYRSLFLGLATEALAAASARPEPFDGFDPSDLDGSIDRLVEFNRRSAKTHSGVYRDLAVRKRKTEPILDALVGPLIERTVELIREIEAGRRICEVANLDLLAAYARCEEWEPRLNAVIALLPPGERAPAGPLHGGIVAIKDNIDVQGVVTTNASLAGVPGPAERDATVVARLRADGADLLCKTNLLEYAAGSVSPAYGMTFNPRDVQKTSGGSSGGSAALVAAGVCDYALGTDTGGSIRVPAAYCGVVGLKPTSGLVPIAGVSDLAPSCDHVGTLTRTVEQTAALLAAISGTAVALRPVAGLRIGVLARQLEDSDLAVGVRERVLAALDSLRAAGFELVDVDVPELELADATLTAIVIKEAFDTHRALLEREGDRLGPGTRALLEAGAQIDDDGYRAALADRARIAAGFERVFATVAVLAGPTAPSVAPAEDPRFDAPEGDVEGRYTGPYNLTGAPAVSLPCGPAESGLPAGLQLAAPVHQDDLLLSVARDYERVMR
jgi:2-dehydropantoate 2-reductase